jgi:hypothetical protein
LDRYGRIPTVAQSRLEGEDAEVRATLDALLNDARVEIVDGRLSDLVAGQPYSEAPPAPPGWREE